MVNILSGTRLRLLVVVWLAAAGLLGCGSQGEPAAVQQTLATCGHAVSGAHYTVCGHWSSLAQGAVTGGRLTVVGALESTPPPAGIHYAVQGGTFHASR